MSEPIDTLTSLHTALIDSRNGYEEALEDAEGRGLTPLFSEMIAIHGKDAEDLAGRLTELGAQVDDGGSFMSTVNRTVISVRSLFQELDESILPGLIDGEERILGYYDEALAAAASGTPEHVMLAAQREALVQKLADLRRQERKSA